jgi:hypothetical protein
LPGVRESLLSPKSFVCWSNHHAHHFLRTHEALGGLVFELYTGL